MPHIQEEKKHNKNQQTPCAKESAFFNTIKDFVVQGVNGLVINMMNPPLLIHLENLDEAQLINMGDIMTKQYLNMCWHGYGKKNDTYIVDIINNALAHNVIKGSVCLLIKFNIYFVKIMLVLKLPILINKLKGINRNIQRSILTILISGSYDAMTLPVEDIKCEGDKCDDSYNNIDLFVFSDSEPLHEQ